MAITIYQDLIQGTSYSEDDRTGSLDRPYRVCGLPSNSGITAAALYAIDGAKVIPKAGQFHPEMPDFRVRGVDVKPIPMSRTDVRLLVRYVKVRRRLLDIRMSNIPLNKEADKDRTGELLLVGYKEPARLPNGGVGPSTDPKTPFPLTPKVNDGWRYDYGRVNFLMSETTLEIDYMERSSPFVQMQPYVQTLNSKPWQGRDARHWFCAGFTARIDSPIPKNVDDSIDGDGVITGKAKFDWVVSRRFYLLPTPPQGEGWDPLLIFVDRAVGLSPSDINPKAGGWLDGATMGNGWRKVELYDEKDFNDLNLVSAVEEE